jgi:hypothetical protein
VRSLCDHLIGFRGHGRNCLPVVGLRKWNSQLLGASLQSISASVLTDIVVGIYDILCLYMGAAKSFFIANLEDGKVRTLICRNSEADENANASCETAGSPEKNLRVNAFEFV